MLVLMYSTVRTTTSCAGGDMCGYMLQWCAEGLNVVNLFSVVRMYVCVCVASWVGVLSHNY